MHLLSLEMVKRLNFHRPLKNERMEILGERVAIKRLSKTFVNVIFRAVTPMYSPVWSAEPAEYCILDMK